MTWRIDNRERERLPSIPRHLLAFHSSKNGSGACPLCVLVALERVDGCENRVSFVGEDKIRARFFLGQLLHARGGRAKAIHCVDPNRVLVNVAGENVICGDALGSGLIRERGNE